MFEKIKVVLLSEQHAPFQIELAETLNQNSKLFEYHVIFLSNKNKRGAHWLKHRYIKSGYYTDFSGEGSERLVKALSKLQELQPSILLCGGIRNLAYDVGIKYKKKNTNCILGGWFEPPLLRKSFFMRALRFIDYKIRAQNLNFVFAIGDRAKSFYNRVTKNVYFVPYGIELCLSDLPLEKNIEASLKLVFSGGLTNRHDIIIVLEALNFLKIKHGVIVNLTLNGDGPQKSLICEKAAALGVIDQVEFCGEFENWEDRLKPLGGKDIFIYPTHHAGWGLVINEAAAAGCAILGSRNSEAVRYCVVPGANGEFIDLSVTSIVSSLLEFHNDREKLYMYRKRSAELSYYFSALSTSNIMEHALLSILAENRTD